MTYKVIGTEVREDCADDWSGAVVVDLEREDGVRGEVWVEAGVPDYNVGSAVNAGHTYGFQIVRAWGGSLNDWCPPEFGVATIEDEWERREAIAEIIDACESEAMTTWREYRADNKVKEAGK